jgi:hypothetical protein
MLAKLKLVSLVEAVRRSLQRPKREKEREVDQVF